MRRHSRKKKIVAATGKTIRCVAILSSREMVNEDIAERVENKQMNRINEFACRNNMINMHTIRYGIMGPMVRRKKFDQAIRYLRSGKADAIVTTNVWNISEGIRDGYDKLGAVHEAGFHLYSIDDKETRLNLYIPPLSIEKGV